MLLVSGATATWRAKVEADPSLFGVLAVPKDGNSLLESGRWAGDNGAFSGFDADAFLAMLRRHAWAKERCIFVAAPDRVGDAAATLHLFREWEPRIRQLGYPVALVAQNGLTADQVPWRSLRCLFIGGALECGECGFVALSSKKEEPCPQCQRALLHEWKCGVEAARLVIRARSHGLWVHMGRVNTQARLKYAASIGVDSVDGSGFSRYPNEMLRRHGRLLSDLARQDGGIV